MRIQNYITVLLLSALTFSGCENNIVNIPPPVGSGIHSYAWRTNGQLDYTVEDASQNKSPLSLQFGPSGSPNEYFIIQSSNGNTLSTLKLFSTPDTMSISGLTPNSIIALPSNFQLSHSETKISAGRLPKMTHILALADEGAFVASDDSSNIYYTNSSIGNWKKATTTGIQINGGIKGFYKTNTAIFVLTISGTLFSSTNSGKSWSVVSSTSQLSITAIASNGTLLYATTQDMLYSIEGSTLNPVVSIKDGQLFTVLSSFSYRDHIDSLQTVLVGGTSNQGLWYFNDKWIRFTSSQISPQESIGFLASNGDAQLLIGTPSSVFFAASIDSLQKITGNIAGRFSMACFAPFLNDSYLLASETGDIFIAQPGSNDTLSFFQNLPRRNIFDISANASNLGVATDSGIYVTSNTASLTTLSDSLAKTTHETVTTPLFMHLLADGSSGLDTGKTWNAGIMDFQGKPLTITARVTDYFDSIKLTNGVIFSSIYTIKYTLSDSTGNGRDSFPQWLIYFARNEGPILIDEKIGGILTSRVYRTTR